MVVKNTMTPQTMEANTIKKHQILKIKNGETSGNTRSPFLPQLRLGTVTADVRCGFANRVKGLIAAGDELSRRVPCDSYIERLLALPKEGENDTVFLVTLGAHITDDFLVDDASHGKSRFVAFV